MLNYESQKLQSYIVGKVEKNDKSIKTSLTTYKVVYEDVNFHVLCFTGTLKRLFCIHSKIFLLGLLKDRTAV